jgi:transcription initiation factor IIE alpha subunit
MLSAALFTTLAVIALASMAASSPSGLVCLTSMITCEVKTFQQKLEDNYQHVLKEIKEKQKEKAPSSFFVCNFILIHAAFLVAFQACKKLDIRTCVYFTQVRRT